MGKEAPGGEDKQAKKSAEKDEKLFHLPKLRCPDRDLVT